MHQSKHKAQTRSRSRLSCDMSSFQVGYVAVSNLAAGLALAMCVMQCTSSKFTSTGSSTLASATDPSLLLPAPADPSSYVAAPPLKLQLASMSLRANEPLKALNCRCLDSHVFMHALCASCTFDTQTVSGIHHHQAPVAANSRSWVQATCCFACDTVNAGG